MKPGTKLIRISRQVNNLHMIKGKKYTVCSVKGGFIKLKEDMANGHCWSPKHFVVTN